MSVVTFEQETLAVLTELTDEEINGVVGGAKVAAESESKGYNSQSSSTVAITTAKGGKYGDTTAVTNVTTKQEIDNSKNYAKIKY